ncbi:hypothetical protein G6L37_05335 [Agrobacterium rubi]|nr:hypothetical protein [Agrobacterium rubi]NTF24780.1 hypothetical protein [Agrobacterium rubi]
MATDSTNFAGDPAEASPNLGGRPAATPDVTAIPSPSVPSTDAQTVKPSKLKNAGNAMADLIMAIGVYVTGGLFALGAYRKVTALRLLIEAAVVTLVVGVLYLTTRSWIGQYVEGLDFNDPLQRAALFGVSAIVLAYLGGMVVHIGWNRKGDPKVSMLFLAVGMTLIGLRIASLGMAFGEIRVANTRVAAAAAGLEALKSTVSVLKSEGVDPKPVGKIIVDFHREVYGSKYIENYYSKFGTSDDQTTPVEIEATTDNAGTTARDTPILEDVAETTSEDGLGDQPASRSSEVEP